MKVGDVVAYVTDRTFKVRVTMVCPTYFSGVVVWSIDPIYKVGYDSNSWVKSYFAPAATTEQLQLF